MREYQVRFCERLGVKLPGPTRQSLPMPLARSCTYGRNAPEADMEARLHGSKANAPRGVIRRGVVAARSVAVLAAATRPDQVEGLAVLGIEQVGVDGGVEARIVELDREIVAALVGALGPGGADLGIMRCTA
jgi:hypothetical protein